MFSDRASSSYSHLCSCSAFVQVCVFFFNLYFVFVLNLCYEFIFCLDVFLINLFFKFYFTVIIYVNKFVFDFNIFCSLS